MLRPPLLHTHPPPLYSHISPNPSNHHFIPTLTLPPPTFLYALTISLSARSRTHTNPLPHSSPLPSCSFSPPFSPPLSLRLSLASTSPTITLLLPSLPSQHWQVLIPITGRAGVGLPGDLLVALAVCLVTVLPSGAILAPIHAAAQTRPLLRALLLGVCVALCVALLREPFTSDTPKRLLVHHIEREVDGVARDSGLWISAFDSAGLLSPQPKLHRPYLLTPAYTLESI